MFSSIFYLFSYIFYNSGLTHPVLMDKLTPSPLIKILLKDGVLFPNSIVSIVSESRQTSELDMLIFICTSEYVYCPKSL